MAQWFRRRSLASGLSVTCPLSMVDMWLLCRRTVCCGSANYATSTFHTPRVSKWVVSHGLLLSGNTWITEVEIIMRQTGTSYSCISHGPESVCAGMGCDLGGTLASVCDAQRRFSCRYVACVEGGRHIYPFAVKNSCCSWFSIGVQCCVDIQAAASSVCWKQWPTAATRWLGRPKARCVQVHLPTLLPHSQAVTARLPQKSGFVIHWMLMGTIGEWIRALLLCTLKARHCSFSS